MYQSRVYLEVRILLDSPTKAFCGCKPAVGASCSVCAPDRRASESPRSADALPRLSPLAAQKAANLAAALEAELAEPARWERFVDLPPLPSGFSLSFLSLPVARGGQLSLALKDRRKSIRVAEIRIEEDPGRMVRGDGAPRMDYSAAGKPLIRLRTEADFEFGEEAEAFLIDLRGLLQYLGIAGNPFDAFFRCNAFVALEETGSGKGVFVKLRNLNSINFIRKAVDAELNRQEEILAQGGEVVPESRLWNETEGRTERYKERPDDASRYAPAPFATEPLPDCFATARRGLPAQAPSRKRESLARDLGIPWQHARAATEDLEKSAFFDAAVAAGADPALAARWMATELARLSRREDASKLADSGLSPERFARILSLFASGSLHARMAKALLEEVWDSGREPEEIVAENGWRLISDPSALAPLVDAVIAERPSEVARIRSGEGALYDFIIGQVMDKSGGQADPAAVRSLLRERLALPFVRLLGMGGAIISTTDAAGSPAPLDKKRIVSLASAGNEGFPLQAELVPGVANRSEDNGPADWAALLALLARTVYDEGARGVVIAHGTDTLSYTAALVYWLFADSPVPIVLAASATGPDEGDQASRTLSRAASLAATAEPGVYVAAGDAVLSPVNLRFERIGSEPFRNWNLTQPLFRGSPVATGIEEADEDILRAVMEEIVRKTCIQRVYPGMRSETLRAVMDTGIRYLILELYDTGTANLRGKSFSLREALSYARKRGVTIFCTSQQEGGVDFSRSASSRALLMAGAIPMGSLTTESVYARLIAASLEAEGPEELLELMQGA